jgi:hypothetical protein
MLDAMMRLDRSLAAALLVGACSTLLACGHGSGSGAGGAGTGPSGTAGTGASSACVHGRFPSPDIYDANCAFDPAAYVRIAASLGSAEGLAYRFGPDASYYHASLSLPTLPRAEVRLCGDGPIPGPPPSNILYQLGNACSTTDPGNYSSDEGIVLYVSDAPPAPDGGASPAGGGVDNIQIESFVYNSFMYLPSPSADFGAGNPAYASQLTSPSWTALAGGPVHGPVAAARGIAPTFGQTSQVAYVAFADGILGTIGTNTESGGYVTELPAGLVPTSVGLTNGNEFMLVTAWDTTATKGALVVFSIESDHAGIGDLDDQYKYDFRQHLPGFPSTGDATTIKLLGTIDLPGMIAPTDIAVASNYQSAWFKSNGANASPGDLNLDDQTVWQTFTGTGENATQRSTAGFAVITSRSERKVTFVDLQPLFDAFNAQYFTTFATYQTTQSNAGPAPTQWPFTLAVQPAAAPVVVSTITLADIPTAVYAGRSGALDPAMAIHALVATMDGTLHIYDLGGLVDASAASATQIHEIGSVAVGNNPTGISIRKVGTASAGQPDPVSGDTGNLEGQQVFVVARGDRAVDFVSVKGGTGKVYAKLQDATLLDPVMVDDADHESFLSYVLSVADLEGRQIVNYRYGPITFPSDQSVYPLPLGADGKPAFECGGGYAVQGTPFLVSGTNTP